MDEERLIKIEKKLNTVEWYLVVVIVILIGICIGLWIIGMKVDELYEPLKIAKGLFK